MFNKATFQEIPLPSLGNKDNCVAYIYKKYADQDGNNIVKFADLHGKKLPNSTDYNIRIITVSVQILVSMCKFRIYHHYNNLSFNSSQK